MKVLVVNTVLTDPNGVAQVIFNLNDNFDHRDMIVDLVSINTPEQLYYDRIEKFGGKIHVFKRSIRGSLSYMYKLYKCIRDGHYDVIHVHGNSATMLIDIIPSILGGCRVRLTHSHNTTCNTIWLHKLLRPLLNLLITGRLACGEDAGKWLYGKKPFKVINNGIDTNKYAFSLDTRMTQRAKYGIKEGELLLGHVGFFNSQKNQPFLLTCFCEFLHMQPNTKLILVGDGPLRNDVFSKIDELGIRNSVICTGLVNNVHEILNAMDVIVMPSLYEGLPLSLIEQQANGLQCVVADTITREVDKTGNLTFLSLDSPLEQWVNAIESIFATNTDDRALRSQVSIKKIEESGYSIQEEARKLKSYYLNAINGI